MLPINLARMARHTRGIAPVLEILRSMGIDSKDALEGTGIVAKLLDDPDYCITLDGEYVFYRNILRLTNNPTIGLDIGTSLRPETYGIYGYALMSASTLREYAKISADFGALSLTHFNFLTKETESIHEFRLIPSYPIPQDLLQIYSDRDLGAGVAVLERVGVKEELHTKVYLMHAGSEKRELYERFFKCPVKFNQPYNATFCKTSLLNLPLKQHDPEVLATCLAECSKLLSKLNTSGSTIARVTELLVSSRARFLSIDEIASKMKCSSRTLRRNLSKEGSSYAEALKAVRLELAKEYLSSGLKIETVSEMLGYSEAAAFSRAFKQWTELSPKNFREGLGKSEIH